MVNITYLKKKNPVPGVSLLVEVLGKINNDFNINEFSVDPFCSTPVDKHEVAEFWRILSGRGKLSHNKSEKELMVGDWCLFYPYEEHQITNTGHEELKILSIYWKI